SLLATFTLLLVSTCCHGYRFFQDRIPNGANVPHPCRPGEIWMGVGHLNEMGGGERNPFGLDFYRNGKKWDRTICLQDSDEDGKSNGEELGDPECIWSEGDTPARTDGLSHPVKIKCSEPPGFVSGVCDPWNSPECKERTSFVECDDNKLKCPAINEPGVTNFTVRFPANSPVDARDTVYKCMVFDFPADADYHMIANEPYIDNIDTQFIGPMGVDPACMSMIGVWSFGMNGECAHPDMGFRIGKTGFKRGIMQVHWNNPQERADYVDSSGMVLHLTTKLRKYDAGILFVGQNYIHIPPKEENVVINGSCSSECTKTLIRDEVKIPVAWNHMHALGRAQRLELIRDGIKIKDLAYDPKYDYNTPVVHTFETPVTVIPGDEIRTTCHFNSMSRTKTTFYGDGTNDEMCMAFITFYP
ncbi:TBH1-like protein, partial [Mya arenaria]